MFGLERDGLEGSHHPSWTESSNRSVSMATVYRLLLHPNPNLYMQTRRLFDDETITDTYCTHISAVD